MRKWDKQPEKPTIKTVIDRRQLILGGVTLAVMAVLLIVGLTPRTASAPDAEPDTAQVGSDTAQTLSASCEIVQHMTFTRCGHDLTRRQALPAELAGKTRAEAEDAYDGWQITSFSADEIKMEESLDMYCPEHMVLLPDDSGMLCVFQNRYGDALALVRELSLPLTDLPESVQEDVRVGKGFNTIEDLEAWLESVES